MPSTLDRLAYEVGRLLRFLGTLTSAPGGPRGLLRALGWDLPPGVEDVGLAAIDISALAQKIDSLEASLSSGAAGITVDEKFAEVLIEVKRTLDRVRAAVAGLSVAGDYLDKTQLKSELLPRLSSLLACARIGAVSPLALLVLQFFGVVTIRRHNADPSIYQVEHARATFHWDELGRLFSDPLGLLESRYGWGTSAFDGRGFVANLSALVEALGEPARVRPLPRRVEEQLAGKSVPEADSDPATQLIASFVRGDETSGLDAGISLFPLRQTTPGAFDAGVAVCPFVHGFTQLSFPLSPQLTLEFESTVALDSGVAIQIRSGHPVTLKAGLMGPGGVVDSVTGKTLVRLTYAAPAGRLHTLLALPGGGIVEADSLAFAGGVDAAQGVLSPSFGARLAGGHAVLRPDGADSFLTSLIPEGGVEVRFDLGMRWSGAQGGFSFEGSVSAELDFPLLVTVAGLRVEDLHVGVLPSAEGLAFELSVTGGAALGPVSVSLERVGTLATFAFHDGNLGPVDLTLGFKSPSGVGLAVDVAGLTGGGFLKHNEAAAQYAGMLQLTYQQFQLQAFGLIATKLPTGPGYSLVAMIDANFPPIELVAGFTLNGVGGLLGIHRTVSTDALQAALKAHTLSNFLFTKNPVANAPQLLTDLATFFPPADGRYVFGPLLQIGWGVPTVIIIDLALILELPDPVRLMLIGEMAVLLPEPDEVLLELHMDILGTIDFGTDEGSLDAVLHDSRLTRFPLHGAMAFRGCWAGHDKTFLLAVGGFHPAFQPPPGFPTLDRVSISMPSGHISKLNLNGYLAVTSNSLQIGSHLDVFVGVDGFGISGYLNFDTLIQRRPFHFEADISGGVALSADGHDVMSLHLDANMAGPSPWNVAGHVHFSVLGFGVTKHFSAEFGDPAIAPPLEQVDVGDLLHAALADPRNFAASLTTNENGLVSVRTPLASGVVLAHPGASLKTEQHVVPLGLSITRFGAAAPLGDTLFTITAVRVDGIVQPSTPVFDDFAPAQFLDLSNDEELSSPSFESFLAGVSLGEGALEFGRATTETEAAAMRRDIAFETWFVDTPGGPPREDTGVTAPPKRLPAILTALADSGQLRYAAPSQPVVRGPLDYVVATTDQIALAGVGAATGQTYAQARAAMAAAIAENPDQHGTLQIVARHEVA